MTRPCATLAALFFFVSLPTTPLRAQDVCVDPAEDAHARLLERIAEAKDRLKDEPIGTTRLGGQYAVLALWDPAADDGIDLVRVRGGISRTAGFEVTLIRRNGVNSEYRILEPAGWVVLAIKTNVHHPWNRRRTLPVIYVPYSTGLHSPQLVRDGRAYLLDLLDSAADRLDELRVLSASQEDTAVSAVPSVRVLLTILLIEHITPSELERQGVAAVVERVLVTLALNRGDTYGYAMSYAGARGLAQFIPGTYRSIRRRYPRARLRRDFTSGMMDHGNAVMAQYCLVDWILRMLPDETLEELMRADREEDLGAFIAAAYNAGEVAAYRALARDPERWTEEGYGLPRETRRYVRTFRTVYRHLFPGSERNPDR